MSNLEQRVDSLGREINRLWAELNGADAPPLVPLPRHDGECAARQHPARLGQPEHELRTDGDPSLQVDKTTL